MYSVLVFGDSLSFGRGEIPNNGWVNRFKHDFENQEVHRGTYNLSIPGETSYSLKKRILQEIQPRIWRRKDNDKYVVILQVGGNDAKEIITNGNSATKQDSFVEHMRENISSSKELVDEVIVLGFLGVDEQKTQPFEKNIFFSNRIFEQYNLALKRLCEELDVEFVDLFNNVQLSKDQYFDGIHPNKEGHDILYSHIKNKLKHLF